MSLSEKIANAESSHWLCKDMTDEEVIKIISGAKEEARERIKLIDTLDKIRADVKEWYWKADKQALAKDPCVVDAMIDLFIRTIDKYKESEK